MEWISWVSDQDLLNLSLFLAQDKMGNIPDSTFLVLNFLHNFLKEKNHIIYYSVLVLLQLMENDVEYNVEPEWTLI